MGDDVSEGPIRDLWGEDADRIRQQLRELDPELAALIEEVAYGRVFARPGLDLRTKELLAIAHLTSVGSERELRTHVRAAVRVGASFEEVRETILHAAMFVGFPRAMAAMRAYALERRRAEGDAAEGP